MSLWRKRGTGDTLAPFARQDGQKTPKLFTMTATTDNDLSIKSDDLSIKSWVGLTDEERNEILGSDKPSYERHISNMIEAKLKEKNT
jgi:hypothetical protein